jgi:hypothetical protein
MFKTLKILGIGLVVLSLLSIGSCKVDVSKSSNKEITGYWFTSGDNAALLATVSCNISGTAIACGVPNGTDVTALVAMFNSTGQSAKIGNTEQVSSVTANDFTNALTYTVVAEDDTTQSYTVTVSIASASDKSISSFVFKAANNSVLSSDVTATVYENSHTVGASVPPGTDVTALCPSVGVSGSLVSPTSEADTDFTNPVTYTVTAADGTTQDYTATVSVSSDNEAPSNPSISINGGAASTTSTSVTLSLSATDNVGAKAYYASESSTPPTVGDSGWVSVTSAASYLGSVSFTLSSGSATKTVYIWFRDNAGNISSSASDSIALNDLANGLIAYYPFNGNANDESGNGNNGTVNGATLTADRNSTSNSAYSFDGVNDTILFPIDINDGFSRNYSYSVWIYRTSTGATPPDMVFGSDDGGPCNGIQVLNNTIQARFMAAPQIDSGVNSSNSWQHVVITYDGNLETGYIYVDGSFRISGARGSADNGDALIMGALNTSDTTYVFGGKIDDGRVYNRVLSASEIEALYNE